MCVSNSAFEVCHWNVWHLLDKPNKFFIRKEFAKIGDGAILRPVYSSLGTSAKMFLFVVFCLK